MSRTARLQKAQVKPASPAAHGFMLQRKCDCGSNTSSLSGECEDCRKKKLLGIQTKFRISEPGDVYEREADRVAAQVMRIQKPKPEAPESPTALLSQRKVIGNSTGVGGVPPIVHDVLSSSGRPLDAATRAFFEPRFGHDFGNVRIHADAIASQSARSVNALAYTVGGHIVFRSDQLAPGTDHGRRLLAHELSHVVQGLSTTPWKQTVHRKAKLSANIEASVEPRPLQVKPKSVPAVNCAVEITPSHDCYALIGEMIALQADIREHDEWLERYDSGDIPWDTPAYGEHILRRARVQKQYNDKERVRAACCANQQVPGEAPTRTTTPAPQPVEPTPSGGEQ
jgi:Domain of unknown function (DUF4157)